MDNNFGSFDFRGTTAVVTGGAAGMGREVAIAFAESGAKVVIGDINEEGLSSLKTEIGDACEAVYTDVTNVTQVNSLIEHAVKEFGSVDVGVNCAGASVPAPILEISEEDWDKNLDLNLKGIFLAMKYEAMQMRAQGRGGVIINITSVTASVSALGLAHYASAKAGANHLTRIAANEFRDLGIRVVGIAPGLIRTPLAEMVWSNTELRDAYVENVPCNRVGEVKDIAQTALFLASKGADYINGEIIHVDGGHKANGAFADQSNIRAQYLEML